MAEYSPITVARFWSKVEVKHSNNDCWNWCGTTARRGYGRMKVKGTSQTASRMAWELANGERLGERHALHSCDNPTCCNPNHIFAGTRQDNMDDMNRKGRGKQFSAKGVANPRALLSEIQVAEIKARILAGENNTVIAKDFPASHHTVSNIRKGKSWPDIEADGHTRSLMNKAKNIIDA